MGDPVRLKWANPLSRRERHSIVRALAALGYDWDVAVPDDLVRMQRGVYDPRTLLTVERGPADMYYLFGPGLPWDGIFLGQHRAYATERLARCVAIQLDLLGYGNGLPIPLERDNGLTGKTLVHKRKRKPRKISEPGSGSGDAEVQKRVGERHPRAKRRPKSDVTEGTSQGIDGASAEV